MQLVLNYRFKSYDIGQMVRSGQGVPLWNAKPDDHVNYLANEDDDDVHDSYGYEYKAAIYANPWTKNLRLARKARQVAARISVE